MKINEIKNKLLEDTNKKKILGLLLLGIIVIVVIIIGAISSNPKHQIINYINKNNYNKAVEVYNKKINGDRKKELELEDDIEMVITNTINRFNEGKLKYGEAKSTLETIKEMKMKNVKVDEELTKLEDLNNSKIAYTKASEYYKNNDYYNALMEYSKIVESDKNYEESKGKMDSIIQEYKADIFNKIEENSNDYNSTLELLEELKKIIPDDIEVQAKIDMTKDKVLKELKNSQEVEIISAKVHTEWYSSNVSGAKVIIKNNSKKVVKNFQVTLLAYDKDGYPLQISYDDTKFYGKGDLVNIQPGATYGDENYYSIYYNQEKMSKVIACIEKVEYYDGTTWENPYYKYWIEKYDNKQYSE